ncbi:MAG: hypothetical protein WAP23_01020 [Candidatus Spechtbacterales bacterium]
MIYRRLSVATRLIAIVGVVGLMFFYGLVLLASEGESIFFIWGLMITAFIAGPLEILSLLLSFFQEKIGYKLSLVFSAPFLAIALWFAFSTIKRVLLEASELDVLQLILTGGYNLLVLALFALIPASNILSSSQNQQLIKITIAGVIVVLIYLLLIAALFLLNIITLAGE